MFHDQTLLCQKAVFPFLLGRERVMLAFLMGCARVGMHLLDAFVAAVSQTDCGGEQRQARRFEEGKVMGFSFRKGGAKQPLIALSYDDLGFLGVALLFAAVGTLLFFWGRSVGTSVASTTTTSMESSLWRNAFLPGRAKPPQESRAPSILTMVR